MNIQNWGLGQIMQLPDYLFGRRFLVSCSLDMKKAMMEWDISEVALPEMCVIWELYITGLHIYSTGIELRIALGDQLPTAVAEMDRLEPLFMGFGFQGPDPRVLNVHERARIALTRLRMPVAANGRRLVIEGVTSETDNGTIFVGIVVSGVPKEIPDWLVSANLRSP